jgi:hypothetical protein
MVSILSCSLSAVEKVLGTRRASGDVDVDWDDLVYAQHGIGIERAAH